MAEKMSERKATWGLLAAHALSSAITMEIVQAALGFDNVEETLAFYGVYHQNPWNQVLHFFGVPGILWSLILFLVHVKLPILADLPSVKNVLPAGHELTYGLFLSLFYVVFYLQLDPFGGIFYAPVVYAMYTSSIYLMQKDRKKTGGKTWNGTGKILKLALVVHFFSWYIQIHLGHHVIEGAQPASLQSLGGAVAVAPIFAFYEGLWMVGINKPLQDSTLQLVEKYTQQICAEGKIQMSICETLSMPEVAVLELSTPEVPTLEGSIPEVPTLEVPIPEVPSPDVPIPEASIAE